MRDLTEGSVLRHLIGMSAFIGLGLLMQALYVLVDLFFVARLGSDAIAAVSAAATSSLLVMGGSQLIAVGALALISQAVGRRDHLDARRVMAQVTGLAALSAVLTLIVGYSAGGALLVGAVPATSFPMAKSYLYAFLPNLAAMFPVATLSASFRATGDVRSPMIVQTAAIVINIVLAPLFVLGWGGWHGFGVAGAGAASSIAGGGAALALSLLLPRLHPTLRFDLQALMPDMRVWRRVLGIGLPTAAEMLITFWVTAVTYWAIQRFGSQAQAGFGIGSRIIQALFLPAMSVGFALSALVGQSYGAREFDRIRSAIRCAALLVCLLMFTVTLGVKLAPGVLVRPFTSDPQVLLVAEQYLRIASWNFAASGLFFVCSGAFRGLGDTRPSLISCATRVATFIIPIYMLAGLPQLELRHIWWLAVFAITAQTAVALLLAMNRTSRVRDLASGAAPQMS